MDKHSSYSLQTESQHIIDDYCHVRRAGMDATSMAYSQQLNLSTLACDAPHPADDGAFTMSSDLRAHQESSPFCIRGYVASVREIDIARCWPFSQKLLEEAIQLRKDPLLPPLTPIACNVQIQAEYYRNVSCENLDAVCNMSGGPQLQVQIDVSKCETEAQAATKSGEPPYDEEDKFASKATQEACSPIHRQLPHMMQDSSFSDHGLLLKRRAPRSIREIRRSIMQGCQCFKRMESDLCTKDTCRTSENLACMDEGSDALKPDEHANASLDDVIWGGSWNKNIAPNANISDVTSELECNERDANRGKDYIGVQVCHVHGRPTRTSNVHRLHEEEESAGGAAVQLTASSCDTIRESGVALEENPLLITQAGIDPAASPVNQGSYMHMDCNLDSQSTVGKSIESQISKFLCSSGPGSNIMAESMQEEDGAFESLPSPDNMIPQQTCPVCLIFQCSSNTALNAHIDRCLVACTSTGEMMDKSKSKLHRGKVRKKRSMAELCQVAPPCAISDELVASQRVKEITTTEFLKRKRTKLLHPQAELQKTTIAATQSARNKTTIAATQALQFLQWRSGSASSRRVRDPQISHGLTRRSVYHEARLATSNKSRLRSRDMEIKACSVLRKKRWKRQKINCQPDAVSAQKLKKLMQTEKKKCRREFHKDVRQFLSTLPQTVNFKASKESHSRVLHKDKPAASSSMLAPKRKPSKQTTHVRTSNTVVTVKGSHKTTLEILRPDDPVNEELNQPKKIHFRVHVEPAKKPNKQRTTGDMLQRIHSRENITRVPSKDANGSHNQTLIGKAGKPFEAARSAQTELVNDNNGRLAKEGSLPVPLLPPVMQSPLAEVRMPQVTPGLHSDIPFIDNDGRSRTEDITRCFTDVDDVPLLSRSRLPKGLRYFGASAAQAWHSLLKETRQQHINDSQQAQASHLLPSTLPHCRGTSMQKSREFPFSLGADELSRWPRDPGKTSFLVRSSEGTQSSSRQAYQFRPEQVAELAETIGTSNRRHDSVARQDTARCQTVMNEAGIRISMLPETSKATHQHNRGCHAHKNHLTTQNVGGSQLETWQDQSAPQRLPAWMQTAIHEQRSSAMSSVDLPLSTDDRSTMFDTTLCASRETSRPLPTLDMIANPVLRLMGKTMVLMPETHQNQFDHTTGHLNGSSNYINFFQLPDPGEVEQHRNLNQVFNSRAPEGVRSQDYGCSHGAHSSINSSTPQLQNFFVQMPSPSPTMKLPLCHQQASFHVDAGNMPTPDWNSQRLHGRNSSVATGVLQSAHTNWRSQRVPNTPFFQPQSSLFCHHNTVVPGPSPFPQNEIFSRKQKNPSSYRTMNPVQNVANLTPQYLKNLNTSPVPCWLSSANRSDQPATVIVLDEEGPVCSLDKSTPEVLEEELLLGSRPANQQTLQNYSSQTRLKTSDTSQLKWEKHKNKSFIPIIYTVGSDLGDLHCTPRTVEPRFQRFMGDGECGDTDHVSGTLGRSRKSISCLDQTRSRSISSYTNGGGGGLPADLIRVSVNSHKNAPQLGCTLRNMPSVEAIQAAALPTRGRSSVSELLISKEPSNPLQQDVHGAEIAQSHESQAPTLGMCSVNMNPAEVDCQDTGQFMSTPTLISPFHARPVPNKGQECRESCRTMNSSSPSQGASSSQISLPADKILNNPLGPNLETSLRRHPHVVVGCSSAGKEKNNASIIFNFLTNPSSCEDLSTRSTINLPSAANPLEDGRRDDVGMLQECTSSRMQALKVAGKFKIMNGRVSVVRNTNVDHRAATGKQ